MPIPAKWRITTRRTIWETTNDYEAMAAQPLSQITCRCARCGFDLGYGGKPWELGLNCIRSVVLGPNAVFLRSQGMWEFPKRVVEQYKKLRRSGLHELEDAPFKQLLKAVERINRIALQTDLMS